MYARTIFVLVAAAALALGTDAQQQRFEGNLRFTIEGADPIAANAFALPTRRPVTFQAKLDIEGKILMLASIDTGTGALDPETTLLFHSAAIPGPGVAQKTIIAPPALAGVGVVLQAVALDGFGNVGTIRPLRGRFVN